MAAFDHLFSPRGIAVVGASADPSRIGGQPVRALLDAGYTGRIYPINRRHERILGLRCYPSIDAIDGPCDVAIIAVRAPYVEDIVRQCGAHGIGYAIIFSSGFSEADPSSGALERSLVSAARKAKVRLVGPNCEGIVSVANRVFAVFGWIAGDVNIRSGSLSMVFQSGGVGFGVVAKCDQLGVGMRHCVSSGNEADLTSPDLLNAFVNDEKTDVIFAYLEGIRNGRALLEVGKAALRARKPILVWKGGKSSSGSHAAASHTGRMAGAYEVFAAVARQGGLIEVDSVEEVADLCHVFRSRWWPEGSNVGVVGISGGSGIVFADKASEYGLCLPELREGTVSKLKEILPSFGSAANPVDVTGGIFNDMSAFTKALGVVVADPHIDQVCVLLATLPSAVALKAAESVSEVSAAGGKPILVAWSPREGSANEAYRIFEKAGVPVVSSPGRLALAASRFTRFARRSHTLHNDSGMNTEVESPRRMQIKLGTPNELDAKNILAAYGISVSRDVVVRWGDPLEPVLGQLRVPLVVKVLSPDIEHKTEVGGVVTNVVSAQELANALTKIAMNVRRTRPETPVQEFLVSEMVTGAIETLVGVINDDVFGPVVGFGLGGIYTEVLKDISYRAAPFGCADAFDLIGEIKANGIFNGIRGMGSLNVHKLAHTISAISRMAWELRDQIREFEINPLFVGVNDCIAADALVIRK